MNINEINKTYKELNHLLLEINKNNKKQIQILNNLFPEKLKVLYKEFDIWQEKTLKRLDRISERRFKK